MPDSGDGSVKHGCLNLNKPTHINNGNYTLIVQNKLGRDEATAFGLFMENPFGTLDPEGKILGELLRLNIFISRKIRMVEQVSWLWPADAYHNVCVFIFICTCQSLTQISVSLECNVIVGSICTNRSLTGPFSSFSSYKQVSHGRDGE